MRAFRYATPNRNPIKHGWKQWYNNICVQFFVHTFVIIESYDTTEQMMLRKLLWNLDSFSKIEYFIFYIEKIIINCYVNSFVFMTRLIKEQKHLFLKPNIHLQT